MVVLLGDDDEYDGGDGGHCVRLLPLRFCCKGRFLASHERKVNHVSWVNEGFIVWSYSLCSCITGK